jgi:hypothetical protein
MVMSTVGRRFEVRGYFAFPMPESVVAVLSYWGDDDTPDAFVRAEPTARQLVLYSSVGDCPSSIEGTTPPSEHARVRIAYVDQYGQVSRPSAPRDIE